MPRNLQRHFLNDMKILIASKNKGKIAELQRLLSAHITGESIELVSLDDVGFVGDIEENGSTFAENAMIKANAAASFSGLISVADDSGLEVNTLGGEPGIYSARYAGEEHDDSSNNEKLLSRLADKNDRSAAFVCCMACVFPKDFAEYGKDFTVFGKCEGEIIREYRGEGGFGYDPLFLVSAFGKTFAEMSADEKNAVSHRGKAVEILGRELCARIKNKK